MADDAPFDPLAYSQEQVKQEAPAFDPLAYSQAVVADPQRKTEAAAPPEVKSPSLLDRYLGFQESQLAGATGGIGSLAGGLGYASNLALGGTPEQAEAMRQKISGALTYSPRTDEGKRQADEMGKAADTYLGGEGGRRVGDIVLDKTGSPALAAAANTAVNIPQFLVGAKGGKEALGEPVEPVTPKPTEQEATLKKAQDLGYVVPPATSNPTILNRGIEGVAGKTSVAQAASIKNQGVTNGLVRQELGLPEDAELSHDTMDRFRSQQSPAYEAVKAIPDIKFGPQYSKELNALTQTSSKITGDLPNYKSTGAEKVQALVDSIKPPNGTMSGDTAVELSKSLRSEASAYDNSANRSGDPHDRALARAYRGSAAAVENAIQSHLESIGKPELADNWDQARRNIAKSYSVESALDGAGNVDAGKLGKQLIKGKPLSGNLEAAADFANTFPKAAKVGASKESMPGISPLDMGYAGAAALGIGATGHGAAPTIGAGLAFPAARLGARALSTSAVGQRLARPSKPGTPGTIATPLGQLAIAGVPAMDESGRTQ
jgi:hypothetical protein